MTNQAAPAGTPVVTAELGGVSGTILRRSSNDPFPIGLDLYLGGVLTSNDKKVEYAGLDRGQAPHAAPDPQGRFAFSKVKPGRYALIATSPTKQVLVPDQKKSDQVVVVTVEANKSIDLGTLHLDLQY